VSKAGRLERGRHSAQSAHDPIKPLPDPVPDDSVRRRIHHNLRNQAWHQGSQSGHALPDCQARAVRRSIGNPPADRCDGQLLRNDWRVRGVGDDRISGSVCGTTN